LLNMNTARLLVALMLIALMGSVVIAMERQPTSPDRCGIERANEEGAANAELEQCAAVGEATAQATLGFLYWGAASATYCRAGVCNLDDPSRRGLNPNLTLAELQAEGRRLMEAAAHGGVAEAQNELGLAHLNGDYGVPLDFDAAQAWPRVATDGGDAIAPFNLARMYFAGLGVGQSSSQGEALLRLSAERGYPAAQCSLVHWLSQYSDSGRREEAQALQSAIARSGRQCTGDDVMREMPLIRTSDTL
jgi:TPR repeat protein